MVLCSSCDGVPLKFQKKNGRASSLQHGLFEDSVDPAQNSLDNTFKMMTGVALSGNCNSPIQGKNRDLIRDFGLSWAFNNAAWI